MASDLVKNGKSDYSIIVASGAILPEQTAAKELQSHLKAAMGVLLPILEEDAAASPENKIIIGQSKRLAATFPELELAALKHDGIVMKSDGSTLFLAGGCPRGSLYAVYTFLEEVVGCHWWTSTESYIPQIKQMEMPILDKVYTPALLYRESFYLDAFDGVFAARSKCNGNFCEITPEYGGHYSILGWCHTFYKLLPPDTYFNEHPEWYSEVNGKRTSEHAQLCLTNEAMRAELTKNALEWIRKEPTSGMISISQNDAAATDYLGICQCPACAAIEKEEGGPSGLLLRFVNAVAEDIQKEYPDMLVETLAYQFTIGAPRITRPRENVVIRFCSGFTKPLATDPVNADFCREIQAWSDIAPRLYNWDYVTNFARYLLPHPNWKALAPNIRFFIAHNSIGLFEQGDYGSTCGDFVQLRAWLLAHLMWEPSRDQDALINEFLDGYYGPAAWPLRQYIDLMSDALSKDNDQLLYAMHTTSPWLVLDDLNVAEALFDQAEQAVQHDETLARRVRRARLPLTYAWLNRYSEFVKTAHQQNKPFAGPQDPSAASRDFIEACQEFKCKEFAEANPLENLAKELKTQFNK